MISAFIITKNEESNIRRALTSIMWADEIVVVDGYSTDKTRKICQEFNVNFILSKFEGFAAEKNKAIKACKGDWIVEIDADEELADNAEDIIKNSIDNCGCDAFRVSREEVFMGRVIINADKIRIYKNNLRYSGYTHETLNIAKKDTVKLPILLKHYNNQSMKEYLDYQGVLTTQEVDRMKIDCIVLSKSKMCWYLLYKPIRSFGMYYIYFGLIFKGLPGLFWSLLSAYHEILILAKYYERNNISK
jgi:glycosyltransferase involved in cell wall biosynthesis